MPKKFALIFDVDGVLLQLSKAEIDCFFAACKTEADPKFFTDDWNSYPIRNDEDIIKHVLRESKKPEHLQNSIAEIYYQNLQSGFQTGAVKVEAIKGAQQLLEKFSAQCHFGIATANLLEAAKLRLQQVKLWEYVKDFPFGADGGGHKHQILARAIDKLNLPPQQVIFIGDNMNDLEAAQKNKTHFIGFSELAEKRAAFQKAGVQNRAASHLETDLLLTKLINNT